MLIELNSPCSLPLGAARMETKPGAATSLLGLTLKFPLVQLAAQKRPGGLYVTGPRAHLAHQQAERYLAHHHLDRQAEIEIEWAIPNHMGLGSEPLLGLSVARASAWITDGDVNDTPALAQAIGLGSEHAPAVWGFHQGGLLLVAGEGEAGQLPPVLRRASIEHNDKDKDWAFVLFLPYAPDDVSPTLEADRLAALLRAAPRLPADAGRLVAEQLWPAVEQDDIGAFAQALMALEQMNREALAQAGTAVTIAPDHQAILDLMRANGALAWGQSLTGLALYGLVRGAEASRELRRKIMAHVGHFGGTLLASITDNTGARHKVKDERLEDARLKPIKRVNPNS